MFHVRTQGSNSTPKPETAGSITIHSITPNDMVELGVSPASSNSTIFIRVLPDSGASIDAIPAAIFWSHFKHIPHIDGGPNAVTATCGYFFTWSFSGHVVMVQRIIPPVATTIHVLRDLQQPVLSKASQKLFGMLPAQYPHSYVLAAVMPPPLPASTPIDDVIPTLRVLMEECLLIFDGVCRPMRGPPCHFQLKEGAVPSAIRGSRPISVPLMPRVKQELDSLEDQGIVSKVPEPTLWVHPIVIVSKDDGGIRICGDFTSLNHCIIRPTFDSPTPFQAVRTIPTGVKFFTVIDALKGYHQVELDEESSAMTTFFTPFGRYKYNRLPFGVSLAGDDYGRCLANIFDDFPNCRRVV